MTGRPVRAIAIVGGGTAGWIAASVLARALGPAGLFISLVESPKIGTVGVGEATIPPILDLLRFLGINEKDFVRHTQATYKLGIKFQDWRRLGEAYWHPFGAFGTPIARRPFLNAFLAARAQDLPVRTDDYSVCAKLAEAGRFPDPAQMASLGADFRYALHFDASLVADYLAAYAKHLGVRHIQAEVQDVHLDAHGYIAGLQLDSGETLAADLFIDCSGFRGLLIEGALKTGYCDWSRHLPCNRAYAVQTARQDPLAPYTLSRARTAGWTWRIPLQHRTGNGHVYCSDYIADQTALDDLMAGLDGPPVTDPRLLRFTTGRRRKVWNKNCIALGLAAAFLEPLESTSIHLVVSGVYNLLEHFPDLDFVPSNIDAYNAEIEAELRSVRDFIILHYKATERSDAPFWTHRREEDIPDSLKQRIDYFCSHGRLPTRAGELFTDQSWFWVLHGMGLQPERYDPLLDVVPQAQLSDILAKLAAEVAGVVARAPLHAQHFPRSAAFTAVEAQ